MGILDIPVFHYSKLSSGADYNFKSDFTVGSLENLSYLGFLSYFGCLGYLDFIDGSFLDSYLCAVAIAVVEPAPFQCSYGHHLIPLNYKGNKRKCRQLYGFIRCCMRLHHNNLIRFDQT